MASQGYLSAAFQRLDLLLHREIIRLRARYQLSLDEFRGLYISDDQVNRLIDRSVNHEGSTSAVEELTQRAELLLPAIRGCTDSPWQKLAAEFSLSQVEQDILLLAVAPEIDLKYETLFAYLSNDVTRKWPTFDLAMRACCVKADDELLIRRILQSRSTLFASGLVQPAGSPVQQSSWLSTAFAAAPVVIHYLTGTPLLDGLLSPFVEEKTAGVEWERLPVSSEQKSVLRRIPGLFSDSLSGGPIVIFIGHEGSGRNLVAEAVCRDMGLSLLCVDLESLCSAGESVDRLMRAILLQQRLHPAGIHLNHIDALFDGERRSVADARALLSGLCEARKPLFVASGPGTPWRELCEGKRIVCFNLDDPGYQTRMRLWEDALTKYNVHVARPDLEALADRFMLTSGQIATAAESLVDAQALRDAETHTISDPSLLFEAARAQSDQSLGGLAVKVKCIHCWDDLVLPPMTLQRVKEIAAAVRYRHVVYLEWGFAERVAAGQGLKVLFSGGSGTGKTMTAGVIARDLGLDLYKIDLSGVVSKYIGETEKNLNRIFQAAECSNAILMFDEADALFGRRSEVKDAHDRYANIEVAYLLQKIEEYEGVVILASNLSKNIDEAFSRRMHYVVEFPLPDEVHRAKLWQRIFPPEAPLADDVDFGFLAGQFSITGGDIRNVALDAAFLAAQNGQVVTMKQLIQAMSRQMMKQGRIASPADFKQYQTLIE